MICFFAFDKNDLLFALDKNDLLFRIHLKESIIMVMSL